MMSVHPNDVGTLQGLLGVARLVLSRPQNAPLYQAEIVEAADNVIAARRIPSPSERVGNAEVALAAMLAEIAFKPLPLADVMRCADIARRTLPLVEDHLFIAAADAAARGRFE